MNINDIKTTISNKVNSPVVKLDFSRQLDENDNPTEWLSYWSKEPRFRVLVHENVVAAIKEGSDKLALKQEVRTPANGEDDYIQFVIITPKDIEASF